MRWLELSAPVDSSDAEVVAEVLGRFAYGGVAIEEDFLWGQGEEPTPGEQRRVLVRIFLPLDNFLPKKRAALEEALARLEPRIPIELLQCEIEEQEWETAWRKHYKTMEIGRRLIIKPAWEDYKARVEQVVIEVDPGMAFGTGLHATTRLCLLALEAYLRPGMAVLDLGTGSGILAIAAAKLGASSVLALDINPAVVTIARGNVQANGVAGTVTVDHGTVPLGNGMMFDLVAANITADVIEELSHPLACSLEPKGIIIASGFAEDRLDGVVERLEQVGVKMIEVFAEDMWRAIVAQAGVF
ncbi:Ribosomal protein L11 methyltransferase [subsurface metagenome]